jgi:hypothetical protein
VGEARKISKDGPARKTKEGAGVSLKQRLAFVTVRALLGIKLISGNAKDIVALDANAMDESLPRFWRLPRSMDRDCKGSVGSFVHRGILT